MTTNNKIKISVEADKEGRGVIDKFIHIKLQGKNLSSTVSTQDQSVSLFLDEKTADNLQFHLQTLLMELQPKDYR